MNVAELKRPGHDEMRAIVNELYRTTNGWDGPGAREGIAMVRTFDGQLADLISKWFDSGCDIRRYLESRGL